jgi:hypothetical protein
MIVVRVELHSAINGSVREVARMYLSNVGGDAVKGDYEVRTLRGRSTAELNKAIVNRRGQVKGYARAALHVWHLVAQALLSVGYGKPVTAPEADAPIDEARLL